MRALISLSVVTSLALLTGCHFRSQTVHFAPSPSVTSSSIGHNSLVWTRVLDGRDSSIIGSRGAGQYKDSSGMITASEGLDASLLTAIQAALRTKGFRTSDTQRADAGTLAVEVRGLHYGWQSSLLGGSLKVECIIKGSATRSSKTIEKVYRAEKVADTNWTPTAEYNEKLVNDALSEALSKLLNDDELLNLLAKR